MCIKWLACMRRGARRVPARAASATSGGSGSGSDDNALATALEGAIASEAPTTRPAPAAGADGAVRMEVDGGAGARPAGASAAEPTATAGQGAGAQDEGQAGGLRVPELHAQPPWLPWPQPSTSGAPAAAPVGGGLDNPRINPSRSPGTGPSPAPAGPRGEPAQQARTVAPADVPGLGQETLRLRSITWPQGPRPPAQPPPRRPDAWDRGGAGGAGGQGRVDQGSGRVEQGQGRVEQGQRAGARLPAASAASVHLRLMDAGGRPILRLWRPHQQHQVRLCDGVCATPSPLINAANSLLYTKTKKLALLCICASTCLQQVNVC